MAHNSISSIQIEELPDEEKKILKEKNFSALLAWVIARPMNLLLPSAYKKMWEKIQRFEYREKDVVLLAYPKTGTTWLSEILWAMTSVDKLHLAEEQILSDRIYFLHHDVTRTFTKEDNTPFMRKFLTLFPDGDPDEGFVLPLAKVAPDRRVLRTHFLPSLLHPDMLKVCKVAAIFRNPKDTCYSSYNFFKDLERTKFQGSFQDMFDLFLRGLTPLGSYWNWVREMWQLRHEPNLHIVFYENLKEDLKGELEKLNEFFQFHLDDEQIQKVCRYVTLENMKRKEKKAPYCLTTRGTFYGEGKYGSWKKHFTPEMNQRMDLCIEEQFKGIDIKFKYE